jgi:hypothetical protein
VKASGDRVLRITASWNRINASHKLVSRQRSYQGAENLLDYDNELLSHNT